MLTSDRRPSPYASSDGVADATSPPMHEHREHSPTRDETSVLASRRSVLVALKVNKGAPHGMCTTLKDQINEDLLAFIKA